MLKAGLFVVVHVVHLLVCTSLLRYNGEIMKVVVIMNRVVVTHKDDAQRYIKSGWTLESEQEVILPGINKQYTECTLYWKQSGEPAAPDGPEVELKTKDITPSPKRRR